MLRQLVTIPKVSVFFLEPSGIGQHYLQQIGGAARTVNWTMKTLPDEPRQVTRVVYVSMRDENGVQRTRIKRRVLPIAFAQFLEPLKQPAIHQHTALTRIDQILRSGDSPHAAPKFNTCHFNPPSVMPRAVRLSPPHLAFRSRL